MSWYSEGAVSIEAGTTALVGTLTMFGAPDVPGDGTNVKAGDTLIIGGVPAVIASVTDNTHATLVEGWPGETAEDAAYVISHTGEGWFLNVAIHETLVAFLSRMQEGGRLFGTVGQPSNDIGEDGDVALDASVDPTVIYFKEDGEWSGGTSLAGTTWLTGSGEPGSGTGGNGDFYFRSSNGAVYQKQDGSWVELTSLQGPPTYAGLHLTFDASTATTSDPGSGDVRLNNATLASVTEIAISDIDADGVTIGADVATWANGTSTLKGILALRKVGDAATYARYRITGRTGATGFSRLAVSSLAAHGTFTAGDDLDVIWLPGADKGDTGAKGDKGDTGDTGETGATGAAGNHGWTAVLALVADNERTVLQIVDWIGGTGTEPDGVGKYVGASGLVTNVGDAIDIRGATGPAGPNIALDYAFSDATSGDPGAGSVRLDDADPLAATEIAISDLDRNATSHGDLLNALADSLADWKATIFLIDTADRGNWASFKLTSAWVDEDGWWTGAVTPLAAGGTLTDEAILGVLIVPMPVGGNVSSTSVTEIEALTQEEYDAIETPDAATLYVIVEE